MTMTITRALSELKLLDKRILKGVSETTFVDVVKPRSKTTLLKRLDPSDISQSGYSSVQDLISRRQAIKTGIIKSNAVTQVAIGDKNMTVAEAIETKQSISNKRALLNAMKQQLSQSRDMVELSNQQMELQAIKSAEAAGNKRDSKDTGEEFTNFVESFRKNNTATLHDPMKVDEKIKALETEIEDFESNVDFALSESNAKTTISV